MSAHPRWVPMGPTGKHLHAIVYTKTPTNIGVSLCGFTLTKRAPQRDLPLHPECLKVLAQINAQKP